LSNDASQQCSRVAIVGVSAIPGLTAQLAEQL
jgi:hypothetical protein